MKTVCSSVGGDHPRPDSGVLWTEQGWRTCCCHLESHFQGNEAVLGTGDSPPVGSVGGSPRSACMRTWKHHQVGGNRPGQHDHQNIAVTHLHGDLGSLRGAS